jgi:transcriptional regulator with XRE-family HTH domain
LTGGPSRARIPSMRSRVDTMAVVGARVRALRAALGMTQEDLADEAGTVEPRISELERGLMVRPTPELLSRIAATLGVSLGELLGERKLVRRTELRQP